MARPPRLDDNSVEEPAVVQRSESFLRQGVPELTQRQLPILGGIRHAWDAFGRGDELGTVNLLTPEVIAAAASEIKDGTVVTLK